ncbi:MAG TPA: hypothetical protein VNK49_13970 [Anaerolineales bacterium]|nr:hypothetical protein [Anaerolineales bacterium]
MLYRIGRIFDILIVLVILILFVGGDAPRFTGDQDRVRFYTRQIEFDYPNWIWDAYWLKLEQNAIHVPYIFERAENKQIVFEYLRTTERLAQVRLRIEQIHADPTIPDKERATALLRSQRDELLERQDTLAPFAESVLQAQVSEALAHLGLSTQGQPIPPVLYHSSPTPLALIVSPRHVIQQIANISILPTLTLDEQIALEDKVARSLNVSTLVVPVGGVGTYPTMVMETTNLPWMLETIVHEWVHNYLNIRPLGLHYNASPELRTMNETTASIAGSEVGQYILIAYYPELYASSPSRSLISLNVSPLPSNRLDDPPPFDFRAEMHETRVTADKLLAEGKIEEAEAYMEQRRLLFWQHGYLLRKLNQAYFAFHGAYADVPGGAAGEDPVGPAVRALRAQSASLADFINTIAWMTSFEELQQYLEQ